jgi:hypothetical protein
MLRLITLFSLSLLLIAFSQIKKEFDLQVEIVAKEVEEKPKLSPPQNLPLKGSEPMDLSSKAFRTSQGNGVYTGRQGGGRWLELWKTQRCHCLQSGS